jgi:hypothetical protein
MFPWQKNPKQCTRGHKWHLLVVAAKGSDVPGTRVSIGTLEIARVSSSSLLLLLVLLLEGWAYHPDWQQCEPLELFGVVYQIELELGPTDISKWQHRLE